MDTQEDKLTPSIENDNNNEDESKKNIDNSNNTEKNKNASENKIKEESSESTSKKNINISNSESDDITETTDEQNTKNEKKNDDISDGINKKDTKNKNNIENNNNKTKKIKNKKAKDKHKKENETNDNIEKKETTDNENIKKAESYPTLNHKSSNSSITAPKSILRKRRTGDNDNGESSCDSIDDTSSTSSVKKKHIEFSDDNIVYTVNREEDYEEEDDEAYKGHPPPEYENESIAYLVFAFVKRYLLFALVIAAGFCFSYYSYNSNNNRKIHGGNRRGNNGRGKNKPGPPSIEWDVHRQQEFTKKTSLKRIDSITMSEVLSANPTTTSVFQEEQKERSLSSSSISTSTSTLTSLSISSSSSSSSLSSSSTTTTSTSSTVSVVVPGKESKEDKENIPASDKDDKSSKSSSDKDKKSYSFKRVVAVGDIHGDYRKLIKVLRTAKLVNHKNNWIAKDTALIQTGDLLDRGSDTILIFDLMIKLKDQAKKFNSIVYMLLGNHEIMNLQEDFRYVTRSDVMSFGGMANRKKAFSLEGKYGKLLRTEMNATMIIDDTLFVHAGLTSNFAKFGVDQMNNHVHQILQTYPPEQLIYAPIFSNNGPFWTRFMSWGKKEPMCEELKMVFEIMNVS